MNTKEIAVCSLYFILMYLIFDSGSESIRMLKAFQSRVLKREDKRPTVAMYGHGFPSIKFPRFLPWHLRRGQIKNFIKPIMLNNQAVSCEIKFAHAHMHARSHVCDVRAKRLSKRACDVRACGRNLCVRRAIAISHVLG